MMKMERIKHKIIVRYSSEMSLKGKKAKNNLIEILRKNILRQTKSYDSNIKIIKRFNYLEIETFHYEKVISILKRTFGIGSTSLILAETTEDLDGIISLGKAVFRDTVKGKTFAVIMKRAGSKSFSSQSLREKLGATLLPYSKGVDLKNPEQEVRIDWINGTSYFSLNRVKGQGGFPSDSQGTAIVLISGGFDSCVAAWMLMKRGVLCHLVFCNLAGKAYQRLVLQISKVLMDQWGAKREQKFVTVDFNKVLEDMMENVKDNYRQVILKRKMFKVAEHFANNFKADAIVTGEALAQVSSQTLKNLRTIESAISLPVLRPLIGMNKQEIIDLSYKVGTGFLSEHVKERCNITNTFPVLAASLKEAQAQEDKTDINILYESLRSSETFDLSTIELRKVREDSLFKTKIIENDYVIDCQPKHLYRACHFTGASHIEFNNIQKQLKSLDPKKSYLIYCTYGTQSAMAAEYLQQMGLEAYAFLGGINSLKKHYPKKVSNSYKIKENLL